MPRNPFQSEHCVRGSRNPCARAFLALILLLFVTFVASNKNDLNQPVVGTPNNNHTTTTWNNDDMEQNDDDRTLLDMFGETAKEFLTQRVIPDTDVECKWDWRFARCEPNCDCRFTPLLGDYHLGRSCRLRLEHDNDSRDTCHLPPTTPYAKIVISTLLHGQVAFQKAKTTVLQVTQGSIQKWQAIQDETCKCNMDLVNDSKGDTPLLLRPPSTPSRPTLKERILCGAGFFGPVSGGADSCLDRTKEAFPLEQQEEFLQRDTGSENFDNDNNEETIREHHPSEPWRGLGRNFWD